MDTLTCTLATLNMPNGKTAGRYYVNHNGTVGEDEIYKEVGLRCGGASVDVVRMYCTTIFNTIARRLSEGYRVELPQMSAFLSVPGTTESAEKGSAKPDLKPCVHLMAKKSLKDCCRKLPIEIATAQGSPMIRNVFQDVADAKVDMLINGTDVKVLLAGSNLHIEPYTSDPSVGIWLEDKDGNIHCRGIVTHSTRSTLDATFPKVDLPLGKFSGYLCIASRDMLSGVHQVSTTRHRIGICKAFPPRPTA